MANTNIDFLMKVRPHLLGKLAEKHGVKYVTELTDAGEQVADELMLVIEKQTDDVQSNFFIDMFDIDNVGTGNGCEYLLNRALAMGKTVDEETYEELKNAKERALYFFLHCYDIFSETQQEYNVDNLQGWRGERTISKSIEDITGNIDDFEAGLKILYRKEYKGKHLKVKWYKKEDRAIFIAYIEDSFTNDLSFDEETLNPKTPRRPVFAAYFSYCPKTAILEVKASGGKQRIQQLQETFIIEMLKGKPNIMGTPRYDFEKFRHLEGLHFPVDSEDLVESVTLRGLRIVDNSTKAMYQIDIGNIRGGDADPMLKTLQSRNIDLQDYKVTQFKLEVVFDNQGKGPKRKVTTAISWPNICDLKERPIDGVVRRLLKKWGIDLF